MTMKKLFASFVAALLIIFCIVPSNALASNINWDGDRITTLKPGFITTKTLPLENVSKESAHQSPTFVYHMSDKKEIANATTFPVLKQGGAGMQRISIPPKHLLTPHWHPNSNETTYCLAGEGVVGLVVLDPTSTEPIGATFQSYPFHLGDIVFLPQGYAHYFANTGSQDFNLLLTFDNPNFDILTLADTLQQLPDNIIEAAKSSESKAGYSPVIPYNPESRNALDLTVQERLEIISSP